MTVAVWIKGKCESERWEQMSRVGLQPPKHVFFPASIKKISEQQHLRIIASKSSHSQEMASARQVLGHGGQSEAGRKVEKDGKRSNRSDDANSFKSLHDDVQKKKNYLY